MQPLTALLLQWDARVEARLRQTCARAVEVYARTAASRAAPQRGSHAAYPDRRVQEEQQQRAWKVYIEVSCALRGQVCARVDIWTQDGSFYSKVQSVHPYLRERIHGEDEELLAGVNRDAKEEMLAQKVHDIAIAAAPTQHEDVLVCILERTVKDLVALFYASQVQALLSSSSEQAKFEFEMLQHHPGLELLVTSSSLTSASYVTFTLPLFAEKPMWDSSAVCAADDAWSVYLPDAFNHPNFIDPSEKVVLSIVYSLSDRAKQDPSAWRPFSTTIKWPMSMTLSSHVVHAPVPSQLLSSVEILSSCQQGFAAQWAKRKDFVRELRSKAIVLEYDPIEFSQVFFMVQEQRDDISPLQIVILSLEFTPAYFLTLCLSDLKLSLLDGDLRNSPIEVKLSSSPSAEVRSEPIDKLVLVFLDALRDALSLHLTS